MDQKFLSLFPEVAAARAKSGLSLADRPLVHLAPMVRAGTTAFRSLCMEYGADLVWSEEIIDRRLRVCQRRPNPVLDTVDFIIPAEGPNRGEVLLFRTYAGEKGRVILQLGTGSAEGALQAAQVVARDVAGIDVNMGCPKKFSVENGMGATLLADQDRATDIIRTLKRGLSMPVTAKVRLLATMEETISLLRNLQAAGADAVTVHLRRPGDTESTAARGADVMRELVQAVPGLPLLINGDMYTMALVRDMVSKSGCVGAMLARPLLLNASVLRAEGLLSQLAVMKAFVQRCIQFDIIYQLAKYTLMEMMVLRRHPPTVLAALKALPACEIPQHGRIEGYWEPVQSSKSLRELAVLYGCRPEYDAAYTDTAHKVGGIGLQEPPPKVPKSKKKKRSEEGGALQSSQKLDDSYFASEQQQEKKQKQEQEQGEGQEQPSGSSVQFRLADEQDVEGIVNITNDAYVADEFFKLPAYYKRFTAADVRELMAGDGVFLLAHACNAPRTICGSLHLTRSVAATGPTEKPSGVHSSGNFGAVAVGRAYEKRGIGAALVRAVERYVLTGARDHAAPASVPRTADIEMGVINLRADLFVWYGKLGFARGEEMRPNNEELTRICLPELDVCCVKMHNALDLDKL
jgi:tRNA-dihydrouridine synthase 2